MAIHPPSRQIRSVATDIRTGLSTGLFDIPARAWMPTAGYAVVALVVGFTAGFFEVGWPSLKKAVLLPLVLIVYPSLFEEVIFRGVLLPRTLRAAGPLRQFAAVAFSAILFTLYHPANHYLIGLSDTSLFVEPAFLLIVMALGFTCGYAYLRSGSLWMPIAIHWATTVAWNLFLGR